MNNGKIRVCFLETSLRIGGTETVVSQLMRRLDKKKFSPVLCCLYGPGVLGEQLVKEGYSVYHDLAQNRLDARLPFKLWQVLRRERINALFIVNQPLTQFWGTWCGFFANVPVRITAIRSTGKINRIKRRLLLNRLTFPWTNCITALSGMHKTYLIEREGIDARKIEIIPNGVDLERFAAKGAQKGLRASLGLKENQKVVGIVAMLRPEKAHDIFLKAAAEVLTHCPATRFAVVGEGPEKSRLEALAAALKISESVHFLGARNDIPEILSLLDVAVLSSQPVVETVSNAVLEYMAAGKPVVATNVGSLSEQVEEGKTGFLVPSGDWQALAERVTELLQNPDLAAKMGEAGRKKVEKGYSVGRMVDKTEALLERLVANGKKL